MNERDPDSTRSTLIDKLKVSPDDAAWEEFHATYRSFIERVCARLGLSKEDSEDLCQEVMRDLVEKLPLEKFDSEKGSFRTWLKQRVVWKISDWRRRRKVDHLMRPLPVRGGEDGDGAPGSVLATEVSELDEVIKAEFEHHRLEMVLREVKKKVRVVHFQVYEQLELQGKAPREVAEFFQLEVNHVYKIRHDVQAVFDEIAKRLQDRYG